METAVGTPLYAAPEVVRMLPFDSRCDLWSFGAILFQVFFPLSLSLSLFSFSLHLLFSSSL